MSVLGEKAAGYRELGFHPMPCRPRSKKPLLASWLKYQAEPPTFDEIEQWWDDEPEANIALILGRGTMIVDLDGPEAEKALNEYGIFLPFNAPRVVTGRAEQGQHVYLSCPPDLKNATGILRKGDSAVDVKADGGYAMAPPSIHDKTGREYVWKTPLTFPLPPAPQQLLDLLTKARSSNDDKHGGVKENWVATALQGVGEGSRNVTAAKLAGYLLRQLPRDIAQSTLLLFGQRCRPPMPPSEIRAVVDSVASKYGAKFEEPEREGADELAVEHISLVMDKVRDEYHNPKRRIETPLKRLNKLTVGGFSAGELNLLGAAPGCGKTALATEMATHAAKLGNNVLIVSREMLNPALGRRILAQKAEISASRLKLGQVGADELEAGIRQTVGLPMWFCDKATTIAEIEQAVEQMPEPINFLIVDYLQLVHGPAQFSTKREQVDYVTNRLKQIAMQREIPVLALSALRKQERDHKPSMADLKESSGLEHAASVVLLMRRPDENAPNLIELRVDKGRDGETGLFTIEFRGEFLKFMGERERGLEDYENEEETEVVW